jgi:hypothetical protein
LGSAGTSGRRALRGQLQPFTPSKIHTGNDRSQGIADVARRRERGEEISKADPQRLGTPVGMKN